MVASQDTIVEKSNMVSVSNGVLFFFAIVYIIIDYARPQDTYTVIGLLRPSLVIIIILTVLLLKDGNIWRAGSRQTTLLILFNILIAAYIPFARNNVAAYKTSMLMLAYVPFILAVIVSVDTIERLKRLMNIIIIIMIYQSLYAMFHGGLGAGNYFQDENDLSLYINMWLPFCYFLSLHERNMKMKLLYFAGMIIGLLAIIVSFSRGGFIGLIFMGIVAWWYSSKKITSIAVILCCALMVYFIGGAKYIEEMSTIADTKGSTAQERILSWKAGWAMFLDNPLGVGGNNFQKNFHRYQPKEFKRGMWGRVAHSLWFTLIPELGIIGIFLFLKLLWFNLKDVFQLRSLEQQKDVNAVYIHQLSLAYITSMVGFFTSATFLSVLYYAHYWYLTGLIVATVRVASTMGMNTSTLTNRS